MSNRLYRLTVGLIIVSALYFDALPVIYGLIAVLLFEGVTNFRIPLLLSRLRYGHDGDASEGCLAIPFKDRIPFAAERAWRLMVGTILLIIFWQFEESLWFFPWFMGFAILGAGASGVCPMFLSLKWLGFR